MDRAGLKIQRPVRNEKADGTTSAAVHPVSTAWSIELSSVHLLMAMWGTVNLFMCRRAHAKPSTLLEPWCLKRTIRLLFDNFPSPISPSLGNNSRPTQYREREINFSLDPQR